MIKEETLFDKEVEKLKKGIVLFDYKSNKQSQEWHKCIVIKTLRISKNRYDIKICGIRNNLLFAVFLNKNYIASFAISNLTNSISYKEKNQDVPEKVINLAHLYHDKVCEKQGDYARDNLERFKEGANDALIELERPKFHLW